MEHDWGRTVGWDGEETGGRNSCGWSESWDDDSATAQLRIHGCSRRPSLELLLPNCSYLSLSWSPRLPVVGGVKQVSLG